MIDSLLYVKVNLVDVVVGGVGFHLILAVYRYATVTFDMNFSRVGVSLSVPVPVPYSCDESAFRAAHVTLLFPYRRLLPAVIKSS